MIPLVTASEAGEAHYENLYLYGAELWNVGSDANGMCC